MAKRDADHKRGDNDQGSRRLGAYRPDFIVLDDLEQKLQVTRNPRNAEITPEDNAEGFDYNVGIASTAAAPAISLGSKILSLPRPIRNAVLTQAIEQAPKALTPAYQANIRPRLEERNDGRAIMGTGKISPVGWLPAYAVDYLEKQGSAPNTAAILAQDKRIIRMVRDLKKDKDIAISDDFILHIPRHIANPDKILYDREKDNLLFIIGVPGNKANKLVVEVNRQLPNKKLLPANHIWSGGLVDVSNLKSDSLIELTTQ